MKVDDVKDDDDKAIMMMIRAYQSLEVIRSVCSAPTLTLVIKESTH